MKNRDFNNWLSGFRESIADYGYYINFEKVHRNVDNIKVELNILNSLIGSKNIEQDFENLVNKYPEVLKCIPLLLAVRANEIYAIDSEGEFTYNFKKPNLSVEQYKVFMLEECPSTTTPSIGTFSPGCTIITVPISTSSGSTFSI